VSRKRVLVTGMGCISPLGNSLAATWESAIAGKSGVGPITIFDPSELKTRFAAEVKGFDPQEALGRRDARRMDRYTQLAAVAVQQAVEHAGLTISDANRDRIGVILGTGMGGAGTLVSETRKIVERGPRWVSPYLVPMMLPDAAPGQIAILLGVRGPNMSVVTACASGTNAIGEAAEMIRRGAADVMLAGGSEAGIVDVAIAGFSVMDALSSRNDDPQRASRPFDEDRDGFVIGEGAAFIVLESEDADKDIMLYVNSPGGSVSAGMAIYDTMQYVKPDVSTICIGMAASMGAVLLAGGEAKKRTALPHSKIMIHQPLGGTQGQATDIEIYTKEMLRTRDSIYAILAKHSGKTVDQIMKDSDRDNFMTADEAKDYGLIDNILIKRASEKK